MASIDRHQYSEEIRRGAAKFVKDLNLDTKPSVYVPRKSSVNGENGMLKKVQNNLSSKLEYFQKLDKESLAKSLPRKSSAGNSNVTNNLIKSISHAQLNGDKPQDVPHLNGFPKTNGHIPESNGDARLKNRSSIGAIANFALGEANNVEAKLTAGLEAQISVHKNLGDPGPKVTPLSRLPGQDLSIGDLVTSVASGAGPAASNGLHTAQVAMITNGTNGLAASQINGVVFSRQSSVEKVACVIFTQLFIKCFE